MSFFVRTKNYKSLLVRSQINLHMWLMLLHRIVTIASIVYLVDVSLSLTVADTTLAVDRIFLYRSFQIKTAHSTGLESNLNMLMLTSALV